MKETILTYIVTFLIGILLTSLIAGATDLFKGNKNERKALMMLLQNNLTNLAFVCLDLGYIMDYQLENWCNMLEAYEGLKGNGYIHALDTQIQKLPIKKTDVLQNK